VSLRLTLQQVGLKSSNTMIIEDITITNIVEQKWFSRYPWSMQVTFNRGSERDQDFQTVIRL
jgi:hypothetical protein